LNEALSQLVGFGVWNWRGVEVAGFGAYGDVKLTSGLLGSHGVELREWSYDVKLVEAMVVHLAPIYRYILFFFFFR
jgi:hypothetical protein